jgi:hypothetical protein
MKQLNQLFSPPVLAAFRYLLTALAPLFALAGFTILSPDQITKVMNVVQQFGTAAAAFAAFAGILIPVVAGTVGAMSATIRKQVARVKELAHNPDLASNEAQKALIEATSAMTPQSDDAKQALIAATVAMPEVKTIVTDQATADAAPSRDVISATRR